MDISMENLLNNLGEGAWLFDPHDNDQPMGFITKLTNSDRYQYHIAWYHDSKVIPPTSHCYTTSNLTKNLQPSYDPSKSRHPSQWVPVYFTFLEKHYPNIADNHRARIRFFNLPTSVLENPNAQTIKALYHYILNEIPSLRNTYKNSKQILDMIIKQYPYKEPSEREEASTCCACCCLNR